MRSFRKTFRRLAAGLLLLGMIFCNDSFVFGEDEVPLHIGKKFARGFVNAVTGWAELPKQVYLKTRQGPAVIGTVRGVVEGVGMGFARTTAGFYDIATFPLPLPWHYEPLFEPEYVWQSEQQENQD